MAKEKGKGKEGRRERGGDSVIISASFDALLALMVPVTGQS